MEEEIQKITTVDQPDNSECIENRFNPNGLSNNPLNPEFNNAHYTPTPFHQEYLKLRDEIGRHSPIVAILDTGIDPGALGLQTCPNGETKIIDIIDCTGADMMELSRCDPKDLNPEALELLTEYKISDTNSIDTFKGIRSLKSFITDRKYNEFTKDQQIRVDQIYIKLYVLQIQKKTVAIIDYDSRYPSQIIREYSVDHEYGTISLGFSNDSNAPKINFVFRIENSLNNNNTSDKLFVSLIFDAGSHATHVAGILGGSFNDKSMNGVNPHARFVSLKIGDSRLDGMETTNSLLRALEILEERRIKIANYSYGEPTAFENGRFISELERVINKTDLIFVTSAGNSGPAITTVGAPASSTDSVISVGAYTNSTYLDKLYNTFNNGYSQGNYHWSSRGPGLNHSMGVDLLAAGCALTSHPQWYRSDIKMCNGTSMASPNCAGFISLVLSNAFVKEEDYPHPYWVKKYFESTCEDLGLPSYSQGRGLIGQKYVPMEVLQYLAKINRTYDLSIKTPITANNATMFSGFLDPRESDGVTCPKCQPRPKRGIIKAINKDDTISLNTALTNSKTQSDIKSAILKSDHSYHILTIKTLNVSPKPESISKCTCKKSDDNESKYDELNLEWDEPRDIVKIRAAHHRTDIIENAHLDFVKEFMIYPDSRPLMIRLRDSNISLSTYIDFYQTFEIEMNGESILFDMLIGYVAVNVFSYTELSRGNSITIDPKILAPHFLDTNEIIKINADNFNEIDENVDHDDDNNSCEELDNLEASDDSEKNNPDEKDNQRDYTPRTALRINNVFRQYIVPKSSHIRIQVTADIDHRAFIKICQVYRNASYRTRTYDRIIGPETPNKIFIHAVVPNALTEICIYTPWDSLISEIVSLKITAVDHMVTIQKRLFEPGEKIELSVNRILDRLEKNASTKDTLIISSVESRYNPRSCVLDKIGSLFTKDLYRMTLMYDVNSHPNSKYSVNLCNRVYEGPSTRSATLEGFLKGKLIFYGNYDDKLSKSPVDTVKIIIEDTDSSRLMEYSNLILRATRDLNKSYKNTLDIIRGFNIVELPRSEIQKIVDTPNIFDGDFLFGTLCDTNFLVQARKTMKITNNVSSSTSTNSMDSTNSTNSTNSANSTKLNDLDFSLYARDINLLTRLINLLFDNKEDIRAEFKTSAYTSWITNHVNDLRALLKEMNMDRVLSSSPKVINYYLYTQILAVDTKKDGIELINHMPNRTYDSTIKNILDFLMECVTQITKIFPGKSTDTQIQDDRSIMNSFEKCIQLNDKIETDHAFFKNNYVKESRNECDYNDIYRLRETYIKSIDNWCSFSIYDHRINNEVRRLEYDLELCKKF